MALTFQLSALLRADFLLASALHVDALADESLLFLGQTVPLPNQPALGLGKRRPSKQQLLTLRAMYPRLQERTQTFAPEQKLAVVIEPASQYGPLVIRFLSSAFVQQTSCRFRS